MIIYSLTFAIEEQSESDWITYMKSEYITKAMASGYIIDYLFTKIAADQGLDIAYNIQFRSPSKEKLDEYLLNHAPEMENELRQKFGGKFGTFFTFLEVVK